MVRAVAEARAADAEKEEACLTVETAFGSEFQCNGFQHPAASWTLGSCREAASYLLSRNQIDEALTAPPRRRSANRQSS